MMRFRQRVAWLCLSLFLLLSVMATYCVFDLQASHLERQTGRETDRQTDRHAGQALERQTDRQTDSSSSERMTSLPLSLTSLPGWLWASAYLQLFLFLFSCTRAEPRDTGYFLIPFCVIAACSRSANHRTANRLDT